MSEEFSRTMLPKEFEWFMPSYQLEDTVREAARLGLKIKGLSVESYSDTPDSAWYAPEPIDFKLEVERTDGENAGRVYLIPVRANSAKMAVYTALTFIARDWSRYMENGAYAVKPVLIRVPNGANLAEVIMAESKRLGFPFDGRADLNPLMSYVPKDAIEGILKEGTYKTSPAKTVEAVDLGSIGSELPHGRAVAMYDRRKVYPVINTKAVSNTEGLYAIKGAPLAALIAVFTPADSNNGSMIKPTSR